MKNMLSFIFLISTFINAQDFNWVVPLQNSFETLTTDLVTDTNGNVYAIGIFENTIDVDPGPGVEILNENNNNKGNIFCVKLSSTGNLIWAHQIGGDFGISVAANQKENIQPRIAIDNSNNIYITGLFDYSVDFDTNPNNTFFISNNSTSSTSHFIAKYSSEGNFIWAKQIGSNNILSSIFKNIEVDDNNNIYLSGHFDDTVDFDPGTSEFNLTTNFNRDDIFFMKLDTDGNFIWANQIGNLNTNDRAIAMGIDNQFMYLTGIFRDDVDFNPDENEIDLLQSDNGSEDAFIAKYRLLDGDFQWAYSIGTDAGSDAGYAIEPDSQGNVVAAGLFRGTFDFDFSDTEVFNMSSIYNVSMYLLKIDVNGEFLWVRNFGAENLSGTNDRPERPSDIKINSNNDVFFSGYFSGQMDTNPNIFNEEMIFSNGDNDIFTIRLSPQGDYQWSSSIGGNSDEFCYSIALDGINNVILSGSFNDTVNFNSGGSEVITSSGLEDAFILKLTSNSLDISDFALERNFNLYPNPASSYLLIDSNNHIVDIQIINTWGQVVKKIINYKDSKIDIRNFEKGVYFLKLINSDRGMVVKTFIKN